MMARHPDKFIAEGIPACAPLVVHHNFLIKSKPAGEVVIWFFYNTTKRMNLETEREREREGLI